MPKNTFVNKRGADITGDVTIEYREFHDYADIIVSGIPMTYDSAGKTYNFESAGMFDIKGSQNGEPVFIKPGKNLSVELASNKNENKFNQYYLDTLKRNWQYIKHDQVIGKPKQATVASQQPPADNKKTADLRNRIDVIIPRRLDSVKTVYVKKIDKLPVAVKPGKPAKLEKGKPSFKIDGSHDEFPELSAFENVVFEVGAENKNYSKELHDITWSDVKISQGPDKGRNYLLTLSYRQRKEQLIVYPVLTGADYEKAEKLYETKLAQYEIKKEKRQADEKRLLDEMAVKQAQFLEEQRKLEAAYKKEQELIRANYNLAAKQALAKDFGNLNNQTKTSRLFEVSQFGVYNSDCARPTPEGNEVVPIFVYNNKPILAQTVYFIDYTSKVVIALNRENGYKFSYAQNQAYSLCVFDNNNLYLCNKTSFDLTTQTQGNHFELSLETRAAEDLNELKKALDI